MNEHTLSAAGPAADRLPLGGLLALATAAFITILTEALAGQWVTVYAVGSLLAAIPLMALTGGLLLETRGAEVFPWVTLTLALALAALAMVWRAKAHGFTD